MVLMMVSNELKVLAGLVLLYIALGMDLLILNKWPSWSRGMDTDLVSLWACVFLAIVIPIYILSLIINKLDMGFWFFISSMLWFVGLYPLFGYIRRRYF